MRIYIGGAYNGKRVFVRNLLVAEGSIDVQWIEGTRPPIGTMPIVIAGIERWLEETVLSEDEALAHVLQACANREVYFIVTEIGRGIVPIEATRRNLRDVCGRLYQRLFREATEVTRIWYGIPQLIKGEKTYENLYENRR